MSNDPMVLPFLEEIFGFVKQKNKWEEA